MPGQIFPDPEWSQYHVFPWRGLTFASANAPVASRFDSDAVVGGWLSVNVMSNIVPVCSVAMVILAVTIGLSGCTDNTQIQRAATQRFAGHEFTVPAGWTTEKAAGGLLLMASQVEAGWQANVFFEERVDREGRSLEQGLADLVPNLKARKTQFIEVSRKFDKLPGGMEYGLLEYSCTDQGTSLREWEIVGKLEGGKRLFILASSASSRWDKYQPLFRSLLDSLH